jgi:hypothetical protein
MGIGDGYVEGSEKEDRLSVLCIACMFLCIWMDQNRIRPTATISAGQTGRLQKHVAANVLLTRANNKKQANDFMAVMFVRRSTMGIL